MHPWVVQELARLHRADLDREVDRSRLASIAHAAQRREWHPKLIGSQGLRNLRHYVHLLFGGRTPHMKGH